MWIKNLRSSVMTRARGTTCRSIACAVSYDAYGNDSGGGQLGQYAAHCLLWPRRN